MFRREFGWKPGLLRCIADTATLNRHHRGEDEDVRLPLLHVGLWTTQGINSTAMAFG